MQALGIDIGGSGIKGAVVDLEQGALTSKRHRIKTPAESSPEAVTRRANTSRPSIQSGVITTPRMSVEGSDRSLNALMPWLRINHEVLFCTASLRRA